MGDACARELIRRRLLSGVCSYCISRNASVKYGSSERAARCLPRPGPKVVKLFSCSTQLSMKIFLLINIKMPTIVGMSGKNSILGLSEPIKS